MPDPRRQAVTATVSGRSKPKRWLACDLCRVKKVRCNGAQPCAYCHQHGQKCERSKIHRQSHKEKEMAFHTMTERVAKLEALLAKIPCDILSSSVALPMASGAHDEMQTISLQSQLPHVAKVNMPVAGPCRQLGAPNQRDSRLNAGSPHNEQLSIQGETTDLGPHLSNSGTGRRCSQDYTVDLNDLTAGCNEQQEESSVYSAETYLEYQGPRSFLSICSPIGMDWVAKRTKVPGFHKSATAFTREMIRRLKLSKKLSVVRSPEPSADLAWRYTQAYFERGYDTMFGIVDRSEFEFRLRVHLDGADSEDDQGWYALRNVIYASGCRIELSEQSNFRRASTESWPWFENALSVFTDLVFFPTTLLAVQALAVMAYYTEALGAPLLQYPLTCATMRLACSKGLHRQPPSSWKLSDCESSHRSRIFWAVYCLDKHISSRSGRPSSLDDDEINCQIPTSISSGECANLEVRTTLIKLHKLSSFVGKSVSSARAFRQRPSEMLQTVCELNEKASELRQELRGVLNVAVPLEPSRLPQTLNLYMALAIYFTYHGLLFDIHATLTYPWSCGIVQLRQHPALRDQVESSYTIVAESSRAVILATRHVPLDAACPFLLAYYVPIYAMINLFIRILQAPHLQTVQSDLLILELGASHFTRLEIATDSQISTPFAKDIAKMAREFVERAQTANDGNPNLVAVSTSGVDSSMVQIQNSNDELNASHIVDNFDGAFYQEWLDVNVDAEMEMWSSLMPIVDGDDVSPSALHFGHQPNNKS